MARWVLATGLAYAVLATAASAGEDAETGPEEVVLPDWTEDTDYYEVLGVEREAGERDIKRAYRKRALLYHPDKHPPALKADVERLFVIVATAYDTLGDPERRAEYDKHGHTAAGGAGAGYSSFEDAWEAHGYDDVEDTPLNWMMLALIGAVSVLPAALAVRARAKPRSRRDALMKARERSAAATRSSDPKEDAAEAKRRRRERERRAERQQRRKAADGPRLERDVEVEAAVRAGQEEEARAREAEREADLRRRQEGQCLVDAPSAGDAPWTEAELSALAKGVAKFPGGTRDRWGHIARHVASVGLPHARTPDECAKQARASAPAIRKIQRDARGIGTDAGARLAAQEAAVQRSGDRGGDGGERGDGGDGSRAWTVAEQKALEEALKACPASMPTRERWRAIASRVSGRTAKECVARFKEVRAQVAAKAAAAKA